jgi:LPXTG-motif cell wall-anchored protein
VNLGGTNTAWLSNPSKDTDFWKIGSEIVFTPETTGTTKRDMFSLKPGKKVTVLEASLGANYQLERSDKKNGDYVGLVKFPVNYRSVNDTTGKAGALVNHLECAAFKLSVTTAAAVTPVTPTPPTTPAPTQATKIKTGAADTFLFMGLAMLLALAFMFARKRKTV